MARLTRFRLLLSATVSPRAMRLAQMADDRWRDPMSLPCPAFTETMHLGQPDGSIRPEVRADYS